MRSPAAAGTFYPGSEKALKRELQQAFGDLGRDEQPVLGAVVPHAGYMYSGRVAAEVYSRLPRRDTFVLIGPNHYGIGLPVAMSRASWSTPLGTVEVDQELASELEGSIIGHDEVAHLQEHSLEVQLPFLQRSFSAFRILPISMGLQDQETAEEVGQAVGRAVLDLGRSCTVIASSDLTHYESKETARRKDCLVLESATRMDVSGLYDAVYSQDVTACGFGPIAATIVAARVMGARTGRLLRYSTSGDVIGDSRSVVGYGAIIYV
ncbi:MAG: hypothetical protein A4E45_01600 [Methanosaeta sp. PtaB.Bin039]|nr:MAG: hypothetical protein A4E45_01600 [Methanosaeta sp. PtaB.Bin039]OPY45600.1 MAG: hypothetical protein A4E47_00909 [Methanosaeta sp. PtaU1.Bin028]HOT07259.1 MEMO1 family protein [Methanotrichaceae archaeon]HQF17287.1 MEMO1 family protein [Methanotrichaceae archaeon]HQI91860.1 MEMO1 family protein [Methanotrichaceae archaeon]